MYGGATGNTGQFSITDNTYLLEMTNKFWKKLESIYLFIEPLELHPRQEQLMHP
jgi:hypothetical protein